MEKIITGDWDGEPIWRQKTAADKVAELVELAGKHAQSKQEETPEDDSLCGNPANHDGGETDGCAECAAIRLNI